MGKLLKAIQLVERKKYLENQHEELSQEMVKLNVIIDENEKNGLCSLDELRQSVNINVRLEKLNEQLIELSEDIFDLLD